MFWPLVELRGGPYAFDVHSRIFDLDELVMGELWLRIAALGMDYAF